MHQTAVLLLLLRINIKLYSGANIVKETSKTSKFGNVMRIEVKWQHSNHSFVKCVSFCLDACCWNIRVPRGKSFWFNYLWQSSKVRSGSVPPDPLHSR